MSLQSRGLFALMANRVNGGNGPNISLLGLPAL